MANNKDMSSYEEYAEKFKKLIIEKAYEAGLRRAILNYSILQLSDASIELLVKEHCEEDFQTTVDEKIMT